MVGAGLGSLLGRAPEAIRDLPGAQPATALGCGLGWVFAGCAPGRTLIGLRLPDRGETPTLQDRPVCAALGLETPRPPAVPCISGPMRNFTVG